MRSCTDVAAAVVAGTLCPFWTRRRRIIGLAMCLELLRKEASGNSERVGLMAEMQASNSAMGLPDMLG